MIVTLLLPLFGTYTRGGAPRTAAARSPGRSAAQASWGPRGAGMPSRTGAVVRADIGEGDTARPCGEPFGAGAGAEASAAASTGTRCAEAESPSSVQPARRAKGSSAAAARAAGGLMTGAPTR